MSRAFVRSCILVASAAATPAPRRVLFEEQLPADTRGKELGPRDGRAEAADRAIDKSRPLDTSGPIADTKKPPPPKTDGKAPLGDGPKLPAKDGPAKPLKDWGPGDAGVLATQCLWNTKSEGECKDCCDCVGLACGDTAPCRDACPTHDFAKNTSFITVTVKSTLGPNGDYSTCTAKGTQQLCKECCACGASLACGDTKYCRDQCNKLPGNP